MMICAWIGAILVGITLGLLGSGGSILTVPVLVYWVGQDEKVAFASSLAIVGMISLVSATGYAKRKQVDWRNVLWFGFPGMLGAILGAYTASYVPSWVQLLIFSILLLLAAARMFRRIKPSNEPHDSISLWQVGLSGILVGCITGLVGVGGGFLIVPALVLLCGLSMTTAVGTSLVIITMSSASGFWEYSRVLDAAQIPLDWKLIAIFVLLGIVGSFIGQKLNDRLPQQLLRRLFAVFLLFMGVFILWQNLPKLMGVFA